jgi:Na+/H+ antiporter NhaD/arsenite permease-like protein
MTRTSANNARGFHGPPCWILSALVGCLLGLVLAFASPFPATPAGHPSVHTLPRVKEIPPDGAPIERLPDGGTLPWSDSRAPEAGAPPLPQSLAADAHGAPAIPLVLCGPFVLLLASIALMPFISQRFWHRHFPDFAFLLGALVAGYYVTAFGQYGRHAVLHAVLEYYSFIALVGGLYVVSGGILIDVRGRATPLANTALLAVGAVLANLVGTTGASVLLIRPFMRMNKGRLRPIHVVLFIFIVSNCAGSLTAIGDPPLYLGYLKGVPFFWTVEHMWPMWLACVGMLLGVFFIIDTRIGPARVDHLAPSQEHAPIPGIRPEHIELRRPPLPNAVFDPQHRTPLVSGLPAAICLVLIVGAVFIDPLLKSAFGLEGVPVGATVQVVIACAAYQLARPSIHHTNAFSFDPVKEVGFLFVGIFLTMIPALGYLAANAAGLGLESPSQFYYGTGALSAVLDNAPTYLNFLQAALGVLHLPLDAEGIGRFIRNTYDVVHADGAVVHFRGQVLLEAISLGAVLFGAMTYIGNGPNFMVKSIAEASGMRMPSFLGYLGLAAGILLPVLVVVWVMFIR